MNLDKRYNNIYLDKRYIELYEQKALIEQEMLEIKQKLVKVVTKEPDTHFNGITVYKINGRKTVAWKTIAEGYNPPQELIEENTKIGKSSFGIKIAKETEE